MTIYLIDGSSFKDVDIVTKTDIMCTVLESKHRATEESINKFGILIPWTSILYIR